jgi:transcriptional regulator with XRE-family HTH domain
VQEKSMMISEDPQLELNRDKSESIGKRLRRLRAKNQLSQKQVSDFISVPLAIYKDWEYDRSIPSEAYVKLAVCFNIGLVELMTGRSTESNLIRIVMRFEKLKAEFAELEKELLVLI